MTDAINANSEVLDGDLDAVSGGFMRLPLVAVKVLEASKGGEGTGGGQNDPAQMFQQIMQQLTQGG
ncbi:hypothetical protein [Bradyrhizobium sp. OAE829]|uniref:hypothetical protein n=1 Tax=Bradyrhizobium sp. OAE829 TaxID=2663807 RepID=UPI00178B2EB1